MNKNYKILTESIRKRINPDNIYFKKSFTDELSTISYSDVLVYIRTAMKSVEPEYTAKSKEAGENVKNHLKNNLSQIDFEYQGSVMTDTHIKGYSDIDLLTICDKFYSYDSYRSKRILNEVQLRANYNSSSISKLENEVNVSPYSGDWLLDLKNLRRDCEAVLSRKYFSCDITNPKSIKIFNTDLKRFVDIVIANWYDDVMSIINDKGVYRGIQIYNKDENKKEKPDYPFLSIKRLNDRISNSNGRLRKMIRFLKNVKNDSEVDIDISSFDINAVCYDIDLRLYKDLKFYELVGIMKTQLSLLCTNQVLSDNLVSVDGREYIFKNNANKLSNLKLLYNEVESIFEDLNKTKIIYG